MNEESWHQEFSPARFLRHVQLDKLIVRNAIDNDSRVTDVDWTCILCARNKSTGIVLNDRSFLCEGCYSVIAAVSYPEKYERLHRQHLVELSAHQLAWEAFRQRYEHVHKDSVVGVLGWLSLLLLYLDIRWLALSVLMIVFSGVKNAASRRLLAGWLKRRSEWEQENPVPPAPLLAQFHDPAAELSDRDRRILHVFDHWPGYPPYWEYLRQVAFERDAHRCQVSGCPSRLELHAHHMKPVANGGAHSPSNLVSLCQFHHALEPEHGHEMIWSEIRTLYFTLVRTHKRANSARAGKHIVKAHLRRLQLVTLSELRDIAAFYGLQCPECGNDKIYYQVIKDRNLVRIECSHCRKQTEGVQQLTEETGPRLAELLVVGRNKGRWRARWDMLDERNRAPWPSLSSTAIAVRRDRQRRAEREEGATPACPLCGSAMRIIRPKPTDPWSAFWGCSKYPATGCRGSLRYEPRRR